MPLTAAVNADIQPRPRLSERPSGQPGENSTLADEGWIASGFAVLRKVESLFIVES